MDSNVCVSAFACPKGGHSQLGRMALRRRYRILVSPAMINEVAGVLRLIRVMS